MTEQTMLTVSGSDGYTGPLPQFHEVAREHGYDVVSLTFPGDVADVFPEMRDALRTHVQEEMPAVVVGFSAGAHLALRPWSNGAASDRSAWDAVEHVIACDPPTAVRLADGTVSAVHQVNTDTDSRITTVYPSVRAEEDRISGADTCIDVPYPAFTYDPAAPDDTATQKMDRAHRFIGKDTELREIAADLLSRQNRNAAANRANG